MPAQYDKRFPYRTDLEMPVIGIEAEFKVFLDNKEVEPEDVWKQPSGFITRPLLKRTSKSSQLPTGGAVYFDRGVLEVVTPVIEIAPQCTARAVRSLWEQIGFVRDELTSWSKKSGKDVRLEAFSCHFNVSYEVARDQRTRERTIQKLAVLLALLLPVPVIVAGGNRRSTGIGVRPRRDRIEITFDFIPDPGLMAATTALIVGIVREVISWPSYNLSELERVGVAVPADVTPGKHTTRKGWLTKDFHFPRSPFLGDPDDAVWITRRGERMSLRQMALATATVFRDSIRELSDPFSYRVLFSVLRGETPSLLDLDDRPAAYGDVGRLTRWGTVLPELENFQAAMNDDERQPSRALRSHSRERQAAREEYMAGRSDEVASPPARKRRADVIEKLAPPWSEEGSDRRGPQRRGHSRKYMDRRETASRRTGASAVPSARLTRSAYERVFLKLASGGRLKIGDELLTPIAVKGWYHSVFRRADGEEKMLSIDQLLDYMGAWQD